MTGFEAFKTKLLFATGHYSRARLLLLYRGAALLLMSALLPLVILFFLNVFFSGLDRNAVRVIWVFLISYLVVTVPYAYYYGTLFAIKQLEEADKAKTPARSETCQ